MIAILDYGSGNLRSAERAFELASDEVVVTSDPKICIEADGLVVPGVGAFAACMEQFLKIDGKRIIEERVAKARPIFGICVGMQIFFDSSTEKKNSDGLGILSGGVSEIESSILPHMGWNTVNAPIESKLFAGIHEQSFYFVHSFAVKNKVAGAINSTSNYGEEFVSAVEKDFIVATQFHPEKSGNAGAILIKNWVQSL